MVNYWGRVLYSFFSVLSVGFKPIVDIFFRDSLQFWNPLFNVCTILIIVFLLSPWIEDPKIRSSICSISYRPLPTARILHWRIIHQFGCEISLSFMPVQKQIFGEKRGHNHTTTVVHPPRRIHLSHCCVYDRKSSFSIFPGIFMLLVVLPFDRIEFLLERFSLQNFREVICNVHVKLSPMDLINDVVFQAELTCCSMVNFSDRHCCEVQMWGKSGCRQGRSVSGFVVVFELFYVLDNFQPARSASFSDEVIIFFIKCVEIFKLKRSWQIFKFCRILEYEITERVRLRNFKVVHAEVSKRSVHQIWFLCLFIQQLAIVHFVHPIIFLSYYLYLILLSPLVNLFISRLRKGCIIQIIGDGVYLMCFGYLLQDLEVIAFEEVELTA